MNSQDFLTINFVGAGAFLIWYLVSRGGPAQPTRLNMKAPDTAPTVLEPAMGDLAPTQDASPQRHGAVRRQGDASSEMKVLNVMFIYNGHSWDAYEVLGVPAGASIPIVTEAYQSALRRCAGPDSVQFLETAYQAILHRSA